MKKRFILTLLIVLCSFITLVSCGHKHKFDNNYLTDEENHWLKCSECEETKDLGKHTWDMGADTANGVVFTCTVCGYQKTDKNILGSLSGKNNDNVTFTGVVFGKVNDGFYLSDASCGAYVKLSQANISKLATLKVGDEVTVSGKLSLTAAQVFVKNADVTVLSQGKTPQVASEATLSDICSQSAANPSTFGKMYKVNVAVSKDQAGLMVFSDDTGSVYVDSRQTADFERYIDKKIKTNIVLLSCDLSPDKWTATAFVEGSEEVFINIDDVKEAIFNSISLPEVLTKEITLMSKYNLEPSVTFEWSVKSGDGVILSGYNASINTDITADSTVVLELKIKSGDTSATKEFTVKVPASQRVEIKDVSGYVDKLIKVSGLVVCRGIADESANNHYIIIMDEATEELLPIKVDVDRCKSVKVGDKITVTGKYQSLSSKNSTNFVLSDVAEIKVDSSNNPVDYSKYQAATLATVEDYQDAIDNHHEEIRLYKVISPNMIGSGSDAYSWNQFGPTKESAKSGLVNERQFSLLIANCEFNELTDWLTTYNVPKKNEGAKLYAGTVMYVYSVYQTGATKWSFIIPCSDACFYDLSIGVNEAILGKAETEISAVSDGTYPLFNSVTVDEETYSLTWTSSDDTIINGTTGAFTKQYEETSVVLTASYTIEGKTYTTDVNVKVLAAVQEPLSVSEAIQAGSGSIYKLNAYVAAIGGSSDKNAEWRNGIVLTDGVKVIYYSTADYQVEGVDLQIGDYIQIKNPTLNITDNQAKLSDGTISVISTGNTIDYSKIEVSATITSEEEMVAWMGAHEKTSGLLVKFVGPFFVVGTGSTSTHARYQLNYVGATSSAAARYVNKDTKSTDKTDGRTVSFSVPATSLLMGSDWYVELGLPEKSGSKSFELIGEFYAVSCGGGDTMQAWTIINKEGYKLSSPTIEYLIEKQLKACFTTTEISANQDGVLPLVSSVNIGGIDYPITWTSNNVEALSNAGDYKKVTKEVKVTLTAKYVATKETTWSIELSLLPKEVELLTVSQLKESSQTAIEGFTAIVAGVASGNGGTASTYPTTAIYVTDGTTVMAIDTFDGNLSVSAYTITVDETELKTNDIINVYNVTKNGDAIECNSNTTFEIVGQKTGNDWFKPTASTTITNEEELAAYVKTITATGKKAVDSNKFDVIKLSGTIDNPLYLGAVNGYLLSMFYKNNSQDATKITSTAVNPGFTVGSDKYSYFGCHVGTIRFALGEAWVTANTPVTSYEGEITSSSWAKTTKPSSTVSLYKWGYTGDVYMIFSYSGSSSYPYLYHGLLGAGCTLSLIK